MKKLNILLIICMLIGLFACDMDNQQNTEMTKQASNNNKAYLNIKIDGGRSINPRSLDKTSLTYVLTGTLNGNNVNFGEFTYDQLGLANVELDKGKWDFTLTAVKSNQNVLIGNITDKNIVVGANTLSFTMIETDTGSGNIDVTVLITKDEVAKIEFVLSDLSSDRIIDTQIVSTAECITDTAKYQARYVLASAEKGYYTLKMSLYQKSDDTEPVNKKMVLVHVEPGCISAGNVIFENVNSEYTITFHLNGLDVTGDCILPTWYNGEMYINLPTRGDLTGDEPFYGWYDNPEFKGNEITKIGYNSTGDKEYWAKAFDYVDLSCAELESYISTLEPYNESRYIVITDITLDMRDIKSVLTAYPNTKVSIDLSRCTGLTSIVESALKDCTGLAELKIPDSVTTIGAGALSGCGNLVNLTIPFIGGSKDATTASSSTLFGYIFGTSSYTGGTATTQYYNSSSSSTYYIPTSLKSVTVTGGQMLYGAFYNCCSLTSIESPDSVTSIEEKVFYGCSGLTSVEIGDGVTSIGKSAFYGCSNLTSIDVPARVTIIGDSAFRNCIGLTSVEIPDSVTSIGYAAFYGCSSLTSIEIPNSVTSIGRSVFSGCRGLTSVDIPDSVTSIEESAFRGCSGLTSVDIPDSVTSIGYAAFYGCSSLEHLTIPFVGGSKDATTASESTLFGYIFGKSSYTGGTATTQRYASGSSNSTYYIPTSLKSVTVTGGQLLYGAFYNCGNLTSIEIPDGVTSIGDEAFYRCSGLTNVEIPNSVTSIGERAFYYCSGLTNVEIPNSVTSIGERAFYYCSGLTNVEIGDSVTSIEEYAFSGCSGLRTITCMATTPPTFGSYMLYGCSKLTTICVPPMSVDAYKTASGWKDFASKIDGCIKLSYLDEYLSELDNEGGPYTIGIFNDGFNWAEFQSILSRYSQIKVSLDLSMITNLTSITASDWNGCTGVVGISGMPTSLTSVEIPDSVTSIGDRAFYNCSGLTSIEIPDSVTSIGGSAFSGCTGLTSIEIGDGVTSIGSYAFYGCSGLTSIDIPDGVTSIESSAFYGCSGLTSVEIPDSVTSIGESAFQYCSSLTSVEIPNSVTIIGVYAFDGCRGLTSIEIPDSVTSIGGSAFYGCRGLTSIEIPDSVTSIGSRAFSGCTGLTSIEIPNGVTSIGSSAFSGCSGLTSVEIPDSVTSIGSSAFSGCSGLTSVEIPDSVTSIGSSAFSDCSGLTSVDIGDSVTIIGYSAFSGCSGLTSIDYKGTIEDWCGITFVNDSSNPLYYGHNLYIGGELVTNLVIPDTVTSIKSYAFSGCNLTSIEIPDSVTSIGSSAFSGCSGLTSIEIPNSVTSIGESAFQYCSSLTSVDIGDSVTIIGFYAFDGCRGLTSIEIPDSVTYIGYSAFSGCSGLATLTCKATNPPTFGVEMLNGCSSLTRIYVPSASVSTYKSANGWKDYASRIFGKSF